ncbi:hypothetical protein NL108_010954 [Boleophthalmus pectinirostris]|nr:hypothetical protein NL108_010954 [Boleophthalmus pectinirostris]
MSRYKEVTCRGGIGSLYWEVGKQYSTVDRSSQVLSVRLSSLFPHTKPLPSTFFFFFSTTSPTSHPVTLKRQTSKTKRREKVVPGNSESENPLTSVDAQRQTNR